MLVLAFDAGSDWAAAALVDGDRRLAVRSERRDRDPGNRGDRSDLLALIGATLSDAGVDPRALDGIVALVGPGSFTGTRIACATALGLAAATGALATGVPTLEALALAAPRKAGELVVVVDALRGEWFVQRFARGDGRALEALGEAAIVRPERVDLERVERIVGFEAARFAAATGSNAALDLHPEPALAAAHAAAAGRWTWDPAPLSHPLYLRAPAISGKR
jgi:tRNA threonylcarbamoyladenosine biosynthesis protein TsaB